MTAHLKQHPINSAADHSAGTPRSLLGTNVGGTAITEIGYDNAGSTNAGDVPIRDANGDVLVPTTPTAANAAASKSYVDATAQGLDIKASVRAATTAALPAVTYANGTAGVGATLTANANGALPAQDGVTLVNGDRLLVKDQASTLQNGIYTVTQVGSAGTPFILTRSTDADSSTSTPAKVSSGMFTFIEEGTTQAEEGWVMITANPITMGTTGLIWVQFTGAGEITPGDGLTKLANLLSTTTATATAAQQFGGLTNRRTSDGTGTAATDAGFLAVATDNNTLEVSPSNQIRTKTFKGLATYAGSVPTGTEMATILTAVNHWGFFYSAGAEGTSSVFLAFRRALTGGNPATDFAVVELA